MTATTAVIVQPTFLPWAGWFDLADQADTLILLDDVAFAQRSWQQRNRIPTPKGLAYLTVPVRSAGLRGQAIVDVELADSAFVAKHLRAIAGNYRHAPHFERYYPEFCEVFTRSAASGKLVHLNCELIGWLFSQLGLKTPHVRSSTLGIGGKRGAHLAMLCDHAGANRYLSPAGSEDYLKEDRAEFDNRSIAVELHVYEHPVYRQCFQPFVPYASVLDMLMNEGDMAVEIIRSGRRQPRCLGSENEQAGDSWPEAMR